MENHEKHLRFWRVNSAMVRQVEQREVAKAFEHIPLGAAYLDVFLGHHSLLAWSIIWSARFWGHTHRAPRGTKRCSSKSASSRAIATRPAWIFGIIIEGQPGCTITMLLSHDLRA